MVDTDDTRRTTDDGRRTTDDGRRTTPRVWHKLPTGELKRVGPPPCAQQGEAWMEQPKSLAWRDNPEYYERGSPSLRKSLSGFKALKGSGALEIY